MKIKNKLRFFILGLIVAALMSALLFKLANLTLTQGEAYAQKAESLSSKTISTTGARGRILDRNGVVLAYDQTSYNVEFYRDPEKRSPTDSALYTESLIKAIRIIEAGGGKTIDTSYIRMDDEGNFYYDWGVTAEASVKARYNNFVNAMSFSTSRTYTAEEAYVELRNSWQIPEDMPFEEAVKIISIRQEVLLNNYRAYEPVTIAYNVSMEVVAELDMRADELLGIQTTQSTTRIYPRGTTAAHILGYLSRQVNTVSPAALASMGYQREQYEEYITVNSEGEETVDMTKLGYSYNDYIGVAGIERTMEAYLTASTNDHRGAQTIEVNKHYTVTRLLETKAATDGNDIMLTIDITLQEVAERALRDIISSIHSKQEDLLRNNYEYYARLRADTDAIKMAQTGAIVILDTSNGKVLAMASYPTYDPNELLAGISEERSRELFQGETSPTLNRALQLRTAPGSIFKMATGMAGLMEGKITLTEQISDESPYYYFVDDPDTKVTANAPSCWVKNTAKHANLTLPQAIGQSCNYYFFRVADRLGITKLNQWASRFGLDSKTNIELPGELTGQIGGQDVLYDNTKELNEQRSSLPRYVYNSLCTYLEQILNERGMEIDTQAIDACAQNLLKLQDGESQLGPGIRSVLREYLGLPENIAKVQNWVSTIDSMLYELKWKPTQTIRTGIGQGIMLVTPVAISRYAASIANSGTVYDVHIVDRILDSEGVPVSVTEPTVFDQIDAPDEYWTAIREGMANVVSEEDDVGSAGTAATAISAGFRSGGYADRIMGKTGSAQMSAANNVDIENTSWLIALTPREDPEIAITVYIPNGLSGASSVGAVEDIVRYYLDKSDSAAPENLAPVGGLVPD